jgi:hypothetical protein
MAEAAQEETVLCDRCAWKGPKPISEFDISSRGKNKGNRMKACKACMIIHKTYDEKNKCEHGKVGRLCSICTRTFCECGAVYGQNKVEQHEQSKKHKQYVAERAAIGKAIEKAAEEQTEEEMLRAIMNDPDE